MAAGSRRYVAITTCLHSAGLSFDERLLTRSYIGRRTFITKDVCGADILLNMSHADCTVNTDTEVRIGVCRRVADPFLNDRHG